MTSTPPRSWTRALAVSAWPGPASRVRASERGYRLAMPSPHRNSPAMAGAGEPANQKNRNPAVVVAREAHSSGTARPVRRVSRTRPARQDAEVEDAHRGRGLGGPQPGAGQQFGAEVDRAELDRDANGGHRSQQPAGQRQPAVS